MPRDRRTVVADDAKRPAWARAVAKFTWRSKKGRFGAGTAVLVAPELALTAYHCVKDWNGSGVLRFGFDGRGQIERRTARTVVARSAAGDWALLELDKAVRTIQPLRMAPQPIRAYDTGHMLLAGYSCDRGSGRGGTVLTFDAGCRLKKLRRGAARILTDAICYDGASGGPAFVRDKQTGELHWIGLVQGNINPADKKNFVTYAIYQTAYRRALQRALAKPAVPIR